MDGIDIRYELVNEELVAMSVGTSIGYHDNSYFRFLTDSTNHRMNSGESALKPIVWPIAFAGVAAFT